MTEKIEYTHAAHLVCPQSEMVEAVIYYAAREHWMDFRAVQVEVWTTENVPDLSEECVEEIAQGNVKWDGCANLDIGAGDSYQLHFCRRWDMRRIGRVLEAVYELAEANIPAWDCDD